MHIAARSGHVPFLSLLLEYGADVNAANDDSMTPLGCAMKSKKTQTSWNSFNIFKVAIQPDSVQISGDDVDKLSEIEIDDVDVGDAVMAVGISSLLIRMSQVEHFIR